MRPRLIAAAVVALLASIAIDRLVFDHFWDARVYERDWGRLLRVMGFWPTWAAAALALWLQERGVVASAGRRALLLVGGPAIAGVVNEVLKLLIRRERPTVNGGEYGFRAFSDSPFSTSGLAQPSGHAVVAFAAAGMLAYLFPRARWVWFSLAAGCAVTRVLSHAHFLSDVVAAAIVALATSTWLWRRYGLRLPPAA